LYCTLSLIIRSFHVAFGKIEWLYEIIDSVCDVKWRAFKRIGKTIEGIKLVLMVNRKRNEIFSFLLLWHRSQGKSSFMCAGEELERKYCSSVLVDNSA
jgi:hypothetical protein